MAVALDLAGSRTSLTPTKEYQHRLTNSQPCRLGRIEVLSRTVSSEFSIGPATALRGPCATLMTHVLDRSHCMGYLIPSWGSKATAPNL